ncbi:RluA family pseudouridine synthase [Alteribacillus sp. HJP-4]|uniref:RluA family pseudouridine synthase n=1 Tax=Alteribacillus sp. HJP-4 TaxID=2775394 RepID=UPI0035CCE8E3
MNKSAHKLEWQAAEGVEGMTVREFLRSTKGMSARTLTAVKTHGALLVNNQPARMNEHLSVGDNVSVWLAEKRSSGAVPYYNFPLDVSWSDEHLWVVNKPADLPVLPGRRKSEEAPEPSLAGAVLYAFDQAGIPSAFHAVSRLDRQTSGLMPVALHAYAHQRLAAFFQRGMGEKRYIGVVYGVPKQSRGFWNGPIGRKDTSLIEHEVRENGKPARTYYEVLQEYQDAALIRFILGSGRTHQIRVHCAEAGHPLIGDSLYGRESPFISRQALHAESLRFVHPVTEEEHELSSEMPGDMLDLLEKL